MRATRIYWFCRSLVVVSLGVAVGLGTAGAVARAKDPSFATDSGVSLSSTESSVIARTNDARSQRGLAPLAADADLMNASRRQAAWMARNIYEQHQADLPAAVVNSSNGRRLLGVPELRDDVACCLERDRFDFVVGSVAGELLRLPRAHT